MLFTNCYVKITSPQSEITGHNRTTQSYLPPGSSDFCIFIPAKTGTCSSIMNCYIHFTYLFTDKQLIIGWPNVGLYGISGSGWRDIQLFLLSGSCSGKNSDWRRIVQLDNLQVPTVSHIDYHKLLFNNLRSSDKWQCCLYKYNKFFLHWYHQFHYIPQQQPNQTIQQNRSTWQLLKTTCTNYFYY